MRIALSTCLLPLLSVAALPSNPLLSASSNTKTDARTKTSRNAPEDVIRSAIDNISSDPPPDPPSAFTDLCQHSDGNSALVCDYLFTTAVSENLDPISFYKDQIAAPISGNQTVDFPHCAWRSTYSSPTSLLSSSSHVPNSWNIAFPDQNSVYHVSIIYFNAGDELVIKGPTVPYTRYWSLQTYDKQAGSLASIQDYTARTEYNSGPNAFNNETAGENGDRQGSFDVRITAHGNKYTGNKYINELPALHSYETKGFFFLFLRLYDPEEARGDGEEPRPGRTTGNEECYGHRGGKKEAVLEAKKWGWVCPPVIKRTSSDGGLMTTLPYCGTDRSAVITEYDQSAEPNKRCLFRPNSKDNLFLPANDNMKGEFRNGDANYLLGCAEQGKGGRVGESRQLWARVTGVLPHAARSLYEEPYVGDPKSYDIRYLSISSVNRSPPSAVYQTIKDSEIEELMSEKNEHFKYTREYVIWFGNDEESLPRTARKEGGIFLPWPREVHSDERTGEVTLGDLVKYPGILYREILSQGQMFPDEECDYLHGVGDVLKDVCEWPSASAPPVFTLHRSLRPYCYPETCCGDRPPECCRDRRHIKSVMREHYPSVEYFRVDKETGELVEAAYGEEGEEGEREE